MNAPNPEVATPVLTIGTADLSPGPWTASWAASFEQAGLGVAREWSPESPDAPVLDGVRGIVTDLTGDALRDVLVRAERAGLPTLLIRALPGTTGELESLAAAAHRPTVLAGVHLRTHAGFRRVLTAVQTAEIGLLRAVAADLVVATDVQHGTDMRDLLAQPLDLIRLTTGSASVRLQAHRSHGKSGSAESWAFLGQTDRDVVVSLHAAQIECGRSTPSVHVNRIRIVGTHGWVMVDLLHPQLSVTGTHGSQAVPIGESTVVSLLRSFTDVAAGAQQGTPLQEIVTLSKALDGIVRSVETTHEQVVSW